MARLSLRSLFRRLISGPSAPPMVDRFPPRFSGPDGDDTTIDMGDSATPAQGVPPQLREFHASLKRLPSDARGAAIGLCYVDAKGTETMRRVRINDVYDGGDIYISAFCYERTAPRTFRLDRVKFVFDLDGVVYDDPAAYFRDTFGLDDTPSAPAQPAPPPPPKPGEALRTLGGDQMLLLLAIGRADRRLHASELSLIVRYVTRKAEATGLAYTPDDEDRLITYLRRQYPAPEVIDAIIDRIDDAVPTVNRPLFLETVDAIIAADGKIDARETELRSAIAEAMTAG